jgi:hypothetical protein
MTRSYKGTYRMLRDLTSRIVKFWSSWDPCTGQQKNSWAPETSAQACGRLHAPLRPLHNLSSRLGTIFSQPQVILFIIFVFVTVTRFDTLIYGMYCQNLFVYIRIYRERKDVLSNWGCTLRRLLSEFADVLGWGNQASLEIHMEAVIEWFWRP